MALPPHQIASLEDSLATTESMSKIPDLALRTPNALTRIFALDGSRSKGALVQGIKGNYNWPQILNLGQCPGPEPKVWLA